MGGKRAPEGEEYLEAARTELEIRMRVAGQVHDLVAERSRIGSRGEFSTRLAMVVTAERQIAEALGRQKQAREMGLPLQPSVEAELQARELLRQAVMEVCAAGGGWVAAMDFEHRREAA